MEEKNKKKKNIIVGVIILLSLLIVSTLIYISAYLDKNENTNDYTVEFIKGKIYYERLTNNTWKGEYQQQNFDTSEPVKEIMSVVSYDEYCEIIDTINSNTGAGIEKIYKDKNSNYVVLSGANGFSWYEFELIDYIEKNGTIVIYGDEEIYGVMADGSGFFVAIPTNKPVNTEIDYRECLSVEEINNFKNYGTFHDPNNTMVDKPVIYLYPKEQMEVSVRLLNPKNITCSYPKYEKNWEVMAEPNGDLIDKKSGRELYALYYESKSDIDYKVENEGFIVKGEDIVEFLEEKLDILGLTQRETEEFIIYWLPKMQSNKYNYIRFASLAEINATMPLEINPKPDTIIRILMTFKGLDEPIDITEQKLAKVVRKGFSVVEWGGTEIK